MRTIRYHVASVLGIALAAATFNARAQVVLSVDFNHSSNPGLTMPGFEAFVIDAAGATPVARTYGSFTVTLTGSGANYDSRVRGTPADSGDFTQSLLLRDFVFANSTTTGTGLDLLVQGLTSGTTYRFTIWSFDVSSTGSRVSDWSANGIPVVRDYVFNGSVLPANNTQYTFSFKVPVGADGQVLIQGRRDAATASAGSVFINALQIEATTPDAPPTAFSIAPLNPIASSGSTVTFSAVDYDPRPLLFQWQRSDGLGGFTDIPSATAPTYTTPALLMSDDGSQFRCVASNLFGAAISAPATLTVYEDTNAPTVLSVQTEYPYSQLVVTFSEPVDTASATDPWLYYFDVGGVVMSWVSATMLNDSTVLLQGDLTMTEGATYAIYILSVADRAPIPNVMADTNFVFTAATRLSIDIDDRENAGTTQVGFQPFLIESEGGSAAIQSNVTTRTFGTIQVALSGAGANVGYDDRLRDTPTDAGAFTESLLLRDFVFSRSTAIGEGLDIVVSGLSNAVTYQFTIWSFDSISSGNRVSDWSANGSLVKAGYLFNNAPLPENNSQNQFSFKITAPPSGQVAIAGRNNSAQFNVFLNALRLEVASPDPVAILQDPAPATLYAGGNAIFTSQVSGTAPFLYQWQKDGQDLPGETNNTLVLFNAQTDQAGQYRVVVANATGATNSGAAQLTVLPVADLATALIAYWPLDVLAATTPDVTVFAQDLTLTNMEPANLVSGVFGGAFEFNGTNALATRQDEAAGGLAAYDYPSYTVALWVKGVGNGQSDRRVYAESANTNNTPLLSIGTGVGGTNGSVDIYIRNNNGSVPVNHLLSGLEAFDGNWHHIAWVDNNGYGRIYVDGVADTNAVVYRRGVLTPNVATVGGLVRADPSHWFAGAIDDVAVWGRALATNEIQQVFNFGPRPSIVIDHIQAQGSLLEITFTSGWPDLPHQLEERTVVDSGTWNGVAGAVFSRIPGSNRSVVSFPVPADGPRFYRIVKP